MSFHDLQDRIIGRESIVELLIEAAGEMAAKQIRYVGVGGSDGVETRSYCLACQIYEVGCEGIKHLPSCAVGSFLGLLGELDAPAVPRALVTGHNEREIVLDPVERPTAVELA